MGSTYSTPRLSRVEYAAINIPVIKANNTPRSANIDLGFKQALNPVPDEEPTITTPENIAIIPKPANIETDSSKTVTPTTGINTSPNPRAIGYTNERSPYL